MLGNHDAIATVATKNLSQADHFYSTVLGLVKHESNTDQVLTFTTGRTVLIVYESTFAGTNQATGVNWSVGRELDQIVADLRSRGVVFEHYDMPGVDRSGDIHSSMGMRMVWFKDPDGNIHSVMDAAAF